MVTVEVWHPKAPKIKLNMGRGCAVCYVIYCINGALFCLISVTVSKQINSYE